MKLGINGVMRARGSTLHTLATWPDARRSEIAVCDAMIERTASRRALQIAQKIHWSLQEAFTSGVVRLRSGRPISVRDVTMSPDLRRATVLWEADDDTAARVIAKRKGWLTMHVNSYLGHRLHAALHFKRYDEGSPISLDAPATPLEQALAAAKADLERRGGDT